MEKPLQKLLHNIPKTFQLLTTFRTMAASKANQKITGKSYEDAISVLNDLQSNAQIRAEIAANRHTRVMTNLPDTIKTAEKMGVTKEMLDNLNIIHVAGTKGKGTTCAFTESILRHAGLQTGFFSSPHLIEVRERFKINGKPISPEKFAQYFFETYGNLMSTKEDNFQMPAYFRFLTCMSFYVFSKEKVDVAIVEVGIGGRHDSTNIISTPTVVGITSLGLEHQAILGQTLEEIALNKAGIMKKKTPAFTVYNHPPHILKLLEEHASNVPCPLDIARPLEEYPAQINLSVDDGNVSRLNASLAIQLANSFLQQKYPHKLMTKSQDTILPFHTTGLQFTNWPGRFHIIEKSKYLRYFLDGAHTLESISIALEWFKNSSNQNTFHILIFHLTGERLAPEFLTFLAKSGVFQLAVFCPLVFRSDKSKNDNWSALLEGKDLSKTCREHCDFWESLNSRGVVVDSVDGTVEFIQKLCENETAFNLNKTSVRTPVEVLITGSLHLVGNFLSILAPNLTDS